MPNPAQVTLSINRFSGINNRDSMGQIDNSELVDCQNYDLGQNGELVKRSGIKQLDVVDAGKTIYLIGHFQTSVYSQVIVRADNNLYWSDDLATWNLVAGGPYGNIEWGVQYADKFYMVRQDDVIVSWDGLAATELSDTPEGTIAVVYKDRLFVANTNSDTPTRLYYSEIADFTDFQALGQFVDINQGDGDPIVSLVVLQETFVIFKAGSIWVLHTSADLSAWSTDLINTKIGCISKYSIKEIKGYLVFLAIDGVYRTDLTNFVELSNPVRPILERQVDSVPSLNQSYAGVWGDKYILILETATSAATWGSVSLATWGSVLNRTWGSQNARRTWLVYHLSSNGWTHWLPAIEESMVCSNFLEITGPLLIQSLLVGSKIADGRIYSYGENSFFDGVNSSYECLIETKEFDFGTPTAKRGKQLLVERQGEGLFSLSYVVNGEETGVLTAPDWSTLDHTTWEQLGTGSWELGVFFRMVREIKPMPGPGYFHDLRIRSYSKRQVPEIFYGFKLIVTPRSKLVRGV